MFNAFEEWVKTQNLEIVDINFNDNKIFLNDKKENKRIIYSYDYFIQPFIITTSMNFLDLVPIGKNVIDVENYIFEKITSYLKEKYNKNDLN